MIYRTQGKQLKASTSIITLLINEVNFMSGFGVTVSFIGGENRRTWRKTPTCRESLTNFITSCCIEYTLP
jgi:hypothetical protein